MPSTFYFICYSFLELLCATVGGLFYMCDPVSGILARRHTGCMITLQKDQDWTSAVYATC
jgi:hypothetical protein